LADGGSGRELEHADPDTRPRLVSTPTSPRAVVRTTETTTSWLARPSPEPGTSSEDERASRPEEERKAKHGSSATSSGVEVAVTGGAGGLEQDGTARGAVRLGDLGELVGDDLPAQLPRRR
jgi:hypothetical protein